MDVAYSMVTPQSVLSNTEGESCYTSYARYAAILAVFFAFFLIPTSAHAALLYLSPATGVISSDGTLSVTVQVDTGGLSVSAVEGALRFDPDHLRVQSVTTTGSIFNIPVQEPNFSNTAGTVSFSAGILNPGFSGASGSVLRVAFEVLSPGATEVSFSSGAVLANDGLGTNILTSMRGASYTLVSTQSTPQTTVEPTVSSGNSLLPQVISPTHPNSQRWYANDAPRFTWISPADVDGVSWIIADNPTGNPGNQLDGLVDEVSFRDVEDGLTYFHIKFKRDGAFGPIAHYEFRVDTVPPEPFTIRRVDDDGTDPQPQLVYVTSDETSGVQQYRMRIGTGDFFDVPEAPEELPFRMPFQAPGVHSVTIEAIDDAGLTSTAELTVSVGSITVPAIVNFPAQALPSTPFAVGGTAGPGSLVIVRVWRTGSPQDQPVEMVEVLVSRSGIWGLFIPGLGGGDYELRATATDARGAVSEPGKKVTVQVQGSFVQLVTSLPDRLLAIPLWAMILLFVGVGVVLRLTVFSWGYKVRQVGTITKKDKKKMKDKNDKEEKKSKEKLSVLEEMILDIEQELATIDRLAKSRPLYPEERYLKTKLADYRKTLRKLVGKRSASKKTSTRKKTSTGKKVTTRRK